MDVQDRRDLKLAVVLLWTRGTGEIWGSRPTTTCRVTTAVWSSRRACAWHRAVLERL